MGRPETSGSENWMCCRSEQICSACCSRQSSTETFVLLPTFNHAYSRRLAIRKIRTTFSLAFFHEQDKTRLGGVSNSPVCLCEQVIKRLY